MLLFWGVATKRGARAARPCSQRPACPKPSSGWGRRRHSSGWACSICSSRLVWSTFRRRPCRCSSSPAPFWRERSCGGGWPSGSARSARPRRRRERRRRRGLELRRRHGSCARRRRPRRPRRRPRRRRPRRKTVRSASDAHANCRLSARRPRRSVRRRRRSEPRRRRRRPRRRSRRSRRPRGR